MKFIDNTQIDETKCLIQKIEEMNDYELNLNNDLPIIDQILNKSGLTWTTWKIIIFAVFILVIDGFHLTLFSSMIIPLSKYYKLSDYSLKLIPGLIFISIAIGSFSMGCLNKYYGRKKLIIFFVLAGLVSHILMIYIKSILIFALTRMIIGFSLGIITPSALGILTEYLPLNKRGFILCSVWGGYTFGQIALMIIMLYFMPHLEPDKVQITLIVSTIIPCLTLIVTILLVEDGPRNMILKEENENAFRIIEKIHGRHISQNIRIDIMNQIKNNNNNKENSNFCEIFNKDYRRTTILLTIIRGNHAIYYFGILLISSLTLKSLGLNDNEKIDHNSIIKNEIYIAFVIFLSDFVSGLQTEIKYMGRKITMILDYSLCAINMILCRVFYQYFSHFLAIALFFSSITSVVNHTYCLEVYPTRIRDNALGFLFAFRRLGGFISQVLYIYLNDKDIWLPYNFTAGILFVNVILLFILPYETYNHALDTDLKKKEEKTNLNIGIE